MANTENFSLEGKVALITGASYGIGYAIAKGMAKAGAKIVFNDIKREFVDRGLASYKADGKITRYDMAEICYAVSLLEVK